MPIPVPDGKQLVLQTEDWVEYRTGFPTLVRKFLFRNVPPTGWFHTLGSSLLTVFIIQAVTGALLAMSYNPSPNGAYESIRYITDQETLGWLIRGMHKWGASMMVILLFLHMGRVFFYGAYKYPREMTWLTGSLIFILTMLMGLTGYLLVWDERAYWASVVAVNINGTAPVLGPFISKFLTRRAGVRRADDLALLRPAHADDSRVDRRAHLRAPLARGEARRDAVAEPPRP